MSYILGVSGYFHDSSVCLLRDGKLIEFVKEESLTRIKGTRGFPSRSLHFLIKKYDINSKNVFFCPKFLIERNLLKIFQIINSIKSSNYIFKEHYLNVFDFLKCFYPRSLKKISKKRVFHLIPENLKL